MGFVDQAEVALEFVDHRRVRTEQGAVGLQQVLQRRLPPRELELLRHAPFVDVTNGELVQQRLETECPELGAQFSALDDVVEHLALGGESAEGAHQAGDRHRREAGASRQRTVEALQVCGDALPLRLHLGQADRDLRHRADVDEMLPLRTLMLNTHQGLVHVADVHAGAHVLLGELLAVGDGPLRKASPIPVEACAP